LASLTLHVTQTVDDNAHTHIDIKKTITGGLSAAPESHLLDWQWADKAEPMLGKLRVRTGWVSYAIVASNKNENGNGNGDVMKEVRRETEREGQEGEYGDEGWERMEYLVTGVLDEGEELVREEVVCEKGGWRLKQVCTCVILLTLNLVFPSSQSEVASIAR